MFKSIQKYMLLKYAKKVWYFYILFWQTNQTFLEHQYVLIFKRACRKKSNV